MKIVDPQGKWYVNTGAYAFNDPELNTVLEPGILTKVTETVWIKSQPVMLLQADPTIPVVKADKSAKR
jgi:hypothetical protein